jgi:methyl-accepting chemotaxis protein
MVNISKFRRQAETPVQAEPIFSVEGLEADIREVVAESRPVGRTIDILAEEDYAPRQALALPSYITPAEGVSETGRLTAEVAVQQYEETAKSIEQMAEQLIDMQRRMDQETQAVHQVIERIRETAQMARDEGKAAYERIITMAKTTEQVRLACEDMRLKMAPQ